MLVVVRAIHYLAMAQLVGGLAFAAFIAPRRVAEGELSPAFARRLRALLRASAWIALLSWLVWLVPVAADMAGVSVSGLHGELLMRVVMATDFGHVWLWRVLLSVLVIALLAPSATPLMEARRRVVAALIVAGVTVAALALSGHAAAQIGSTKVASLASDAVHLLAGSTWLGALLPFSIALLTTPGTAFGYGLARRFSWLGIACVVLIIASGIWNSSYLVGSWAALFATNYGHWLLFKLALVASMLMLALRNRRMTPTLAGSQHDAVRAERRIGRNAAMEAVLGVGVLASVGVLGVSIPGAHDQPQWPFAFRLDWESGSPAIVRAYPTSYAHPAVPYTAAAVAQGLALYQRNCVSCHGAQGQGDGPNARRLSPAPADLTAAHVLAHTPGDLYWWISEGMEGTSMPGFVEAIDDRERWALVHLVRTIAVAHLLGASAPQFPLPAPAFSYQIDDSAQQTIPSTSGMATLVVLFTLPESNRRLSELAQALPQLHHAGVMVIALPFNGLPETGPFIAPASAIAATASPDVSTTYRLLSELAPEAAPHVEFLVDPNGWLRARWRAPDLINIVELSQLARTLPASRTPDQMSSHAHHG